MKVWYSLSKNALTFNTQKQTIQLEPPISKIPLGICEYKNQNSVAILKVQWYPEVLWMPFWFTPCGGISQDCYEVTGSLPSSLHH